MNYLQASEEAQFSRIKRLTSPKLRNYIFSVVHETNQEEFGECASFKCAQSALAISYLLSLFEIKSVYIFGAVCTPKVATNMQLSNWHGFWGQDHHYWVMSEFGEIIDLSIAYIHQHPKERIPVVAMPPVWLDTNQGVPNCFKYFHDECFNVDFSNGKPDISFLEDNDETATLSPEDEMDKYWERLERNIADKNKHYSKPFPCLISEGMTENDLKILPSRYLNSLPEFLDMQIPFPDWIVKREAELLAPYGK